MLVKSKAMDLALFTRPKVKTLLNGFSSLDASNPDYSMLRIAICDKITYGATTDENLRGGRGGGKTLYRDSYCPL
jgi:hypothetical protein